LKRETEEKQYREESLPFVDISFAFTMNKALISAAVLSVASAAYAPDLIEVGL
jgi:hypothetical protein